MLNDILSSNEYRTFNDMDQSTQRYVRNFRPLASGRAFCMTQDGNVGLVPTSVKADDTCVVMLGVDSLLVLRQTPSEDSKFVSKAYLDSFTISKALFRRLEGGWVSMSRFDDEAKEY